MALIADTPHDRAEQLILISERLEALVREETRRIEARLPPLDGGEADEKNRLANAYRLELARVKHEPALVAGASAPVLANLKRRTVSLQQALDAHELSLNAVRIVAEGLVQAMAEEVVRQRGGSVAYGAGGAMNPARGAPALLDRNA